GTAGHTGLVLCVELSAHLHDERAQRAAAWRHASNGRANGRATVRVGRCGAQYPGDPGERPLPEYAADIPHQRIPATGVSAEYRVEFQHERDGGRGRADVAERAAGGEGGFRL